MDDEIIEALLKRAKGYSYNEVQEEYSVREDGEIALTKRKVLEKYCPPDSTALKTYMDICGERGVETYTDEELEEEKSRLLKQLYLEEKEANSAKKKAEPTATENKATASKTKEQSKPASTQKTSSINKQPKAASLSKAKKINKQESKNDGI